ncbi:MAG: VOC family protein [Gammaproteobacteria bacterium]|nr:VOC family protein [Gammaproteobacteria bacterium]
MKTTPYLVFRGNAEEAFNYYKDVLKGELNLMRYSEMPGDMKMPGDMAKKVMHVGLLVNGEAKLMGTDSFEGMGPKFTYGDSFFVSLEADSEKEGEETFAKLSEGGKIMMEFKAQYWGDMLGMCVDKFGVYWMILFNPKAAK